MSKTMIVCFIIIGICTIVLISSTVYAKILDRQVKLIMKKNNEIHLLDFGPPSADETQYYRRKTMIKYNEFYGFILVYQIFGQLPKSWFYEKYDEALAGLKGHTRVPYRRPNEKAIACILNHKMEVVYKTEVGPDD